MHHLICRLVFHPSHATVTVHAFLFFLSFCIQLEPLLVPFIRLLGFVLLTMYVGSRSYDFIFLYVDENPMHMSHIMTPIQSESDVQRNRVMSGATYIEAEVRRSDVLSNNISILTK